MVETPYKHLYNRFINKGGGGPTRPYTPSPHGWLAESRPIVTKKKLTECWA